MISRLTPWQRGEMAKCRPGDPTGLKVWELIPACLYFINEYVQIYDEGKRGWIPFELWPAQVDIIEKIFEHGRVCILKARQIGYTWVALSIALWMIVFTPGCHIGLWSYTIQESQALMTKLKDMFARLPDWMVAHLEEVETTKKRDQASLWTFTNNTRVRAMSPTRADSYQFTFVVIDEASLIENLKRLLTRLLPAVNSVGMGRVVMIAVANKLKPLHEFNEVYRKGEENVERGVDRWESWISFFKPWSAALTMNKAKYEAMKEEHLRENGHLDDLHEQYPSTALEALAPASSTKRIMRFWIMSCYEKIKPIKDAAADIPKLRCVQELRIYHKPVPGRTYLIGVDSAEGLPGGHDSAICVVDAETLEECALSAGKIPPVDIAWDAHLLSLYYNGAAILSERNNHGHVVLRELEVLEAYIVDGPDGRPGWNNSKQTKYTLYDNLSEFIRESWKYNKSLEALVDDIGGIEMSEKRVVLLHSMDMARELMSIERATLEAPEGLRDDRSDAYAFAVMAKHLDYSEYTERIDHTMI